MRHDFMQQFVIPSSFGWRQYFRHTVDHGCRVKHVVDRHCDVVVKMNPLIVIGAGVMQPRVKVRRKHVVVFFRILSAFFVLFE